MPLNENGYQVPGLKEIRQDVNNLFIKYFGDDIDLSDGQIEGLLSGILSIIQSRNEQLGQAIYKNTFIQSASGKNLEDHGTDLGIYRKLPTEADVDLQIDGYVDQNNPTIIPAGTQFGTADGHVFLTINDLELNEPSNYKDSTGQEKPLVDEYGNALSRGIAPAKSVQAGYNENVVANTITHAENIVAGFFNVTNPEAAYGGTDAETDDQLRNRLLINNMHRPSETKNGIETAIKNITGVSDARLIANNTMSTDSHGNPAKSCHLYVIGGDDSEIAETYFDHLTPVATTIGKRSEIVKDVANKPVEIKFDRAKAVNIHVEIDLEVDETQFNPNNSLDTIKSNILAYFNGLTMGSEVLYSRLFAPAWSVPGINNVSVGISLTDSNYQQKDISVDEFELPVCSRDLITINTKEA
ncbi:hypothetical protein IV37_GL000197 [Fructilactobacillus fructivorans]|uniref:baseplate J/gp47 family protein n=1 Tax=Fructilactobacillus fructivorans TaxID=1614 RepID=UPI000705279B|nr:baseplate J/gp47 family protein [Fructilactobacillus fructivorans]KRN13475.1 hypothetical protein IV37_GL000197 [Fructilactobacillus fructivorans]